MKEKAAVNHKEGDKRIGKRCGICIHYQRLTRSTNMIGKCEKVSGVMHYGDSCDIFKLRRTAIPDWFKLGFSSAQAYYEKSGIK